MKIKIFLLTLEINLLFLSLDLDLDPELDPESDPHIMNADPKH
jgi:hypothetical protein